MYIKFERDPEGHNGKRFNFFKRDIIKKDGEKIDHTDKSVFGTISEAIKTGENNGEPIFVYDNWNAVFCGKAYAKAMQLRDKDKIKVYEMNVRNVYYAQSKKTYPQITVTDFDVVGTDANASEDFNNISPDLEDDLPFK